MADSGNDRVQRFSATGGYLGQFGGAGTGPGKLDAPAGLTVTGDGTVWVADSGNDRLQRFSATGVSLGGWDTSATPFDVSVGPAGDVYAVGASGTVYHFTAAGALVDRWSGTAQGGGTAGREKVVVESNGTVAIAATRGREIRRFTPEGELVSATALATLDGGIAETADGRLLVIRSANRIQEYQTATTSLLQAALRADRDQVHVGQRIRYALTLRNAGTNPLTGVAVTDPAVAGCAGVVGTLAPGASEVIECSHVAAAADGSSFAHTATVTTDQTPPVGAGTVTVLVSASRSPRALNEWEQPDDAVGIDVGPDGSVHLGTAAVYDPVGTPRPGFEGGAPVAIAPSGEILAVVSYACDVEPWLVCEAPRRFSASGTVLDTFEGDLRHLGELALAGDGRLFAVQQFTQWCEDGGNGQCHTVGQDGVVRYEADGSRTGAWPVPGGGVADLAVAGELLYLAVPKADAVRTYSTDGALLGTFATGDAPSGVDTDAAGNVYVAWSGDEQVAVYTPDGRRLATLDTPADRLALAPDGSLYTLETGAPARVRHHSFAVVGTVVEDGTGDPVPGAWVVAVGDDGRIADGTTTGADGRYRLVLVPGRYRLELFDPSGTHQGEWYDDVPLSDPGGATLVEVGATTVTADASLAATPRTGSIAGHVTSAGGGGVSGAWVIGIVPGRGAVRGVAAGEAGDYEIDGLPVADHFLAVVDPSGAHGVRFHDGVGSPSLADLVPVTAGATATADETLPVQAPPGGGATLEGDVTGPGGVPIEGAWVALVGTDGHVAGGATTDAGGHWSRTVEPGNFRAVVFDPAGRHRTTWYDGATSFETATVLTVGAGGTAIGDVALAADGATGAVGGTVTDGATGDSLAGAWVGVLDSTGSPAGSATTGADGTYLVAGLVAGSYRVVFADPTQAHSYEFFADAFSFGDADPVVVTAGAAATADATLDTLDPLGFSHPWGVDVGSRGDVFVADAAHDRITRSGAHPLAFGRSGSGPGELQDPTGVAVGPDGTIWVADTGNHRVQHFTATGVHLGGFGAHGSGPGQFDAPNGLDVDQVTGNVYVADTGNRRIQYFTPAGVRLGGWGDPGAGGVQFDRPYDVDVNGSPVAAFGSVWVADGGANDRVVRSGLDGGSPFVIGGHGSGGGQFLEPSAVEFVAGGSLWVTDDGPPGTADRVQELSGGGSFRSSWGSEGSGPGQFLAIGGVAIDPDGRVWVTDSGNDRLSVFSPYGTLLGERERPA